MKPIRLLIFSAIILLLVACGQMGYKAKVVTENGWDDKWNIAEIGGLGIITEGNMEFEIKINDMVFPFKLIVYSEYTIIIQELLIITSTLFHKAH